MCVFLTERAKKISALWKSLSVDDKETINNEVRAMKTAYKSYIETHPEFAQVYTCTYIFFLNIFDLHTCTSNTIDHLFHNENKWTISQLCTHEHKQTNILLML